jgi:hypothetical protein
MTSAGSASRTVSTRPRLRVCTVWSKADFDHRSYAEGEGIADRGPHGARDHATDKAQQSQHLPRPCGRKRLAQTRSPRVGHPGTAEQASDRRDNHRQHSASPRSLDVTRGVACSATSSRSRCSQTRSRRMLTYRASGLSRHRTAGLWGGFCGGVLCRAVSNKQAQSDWFPAPLPRGFLFWRLNG